MKGITYCGACADYDIKKHRCKCGAKLESNPQDKFFDDCPLPNVVPVVHCRECEYAKNAKWNKKGYRICPASHMEITDDDFCSYGVREDEE